MKYRCKNHPDVEVEVFKSTYKMIDGKLRCVSSKCPQCGEYMEEVLTDDCKCDLKSIGFGMFSAMNKSAKVDHLKKRARMDNESRSNKERRDYIDRNGLQRC